MSPSLAWTLLVLSGLADVAWAVTTKLSDGYSRPGWTALSVAALLVFLALLTQALRILPLGPAYAVWTGIGAVGSLLAGLVLFAETLSAGRLTAIAMIVGGIVLLRLQPD